MALLWLIWQIIAGSGWIQPLFLAGPASGAGCWRWPPARVLWTPTLWQHLAASLSRIGLALLAAVTLGVPLAWPYGVSPVLRGLLDLLIEGYRPVPPLAYLPLIVIWCGIGELSKVLLIFWLAGADCVVRHPRRHPGQPCSWLRAALIAGRQPPSTAVAVVLPTALPDILTGLRIGLAPAGPPGGGRRAGGGHPWPGLHGAVGGAILVTDMVLAGIVVIGGIAFAWNWPRALQSGCARGMASRTEYFPPNF